MDKRIESCHSWFCNAPHLVRVKHRSNGRAGGRRGSVRFGGQHTEKRSSAAAAGLGVGASRSGARDRLQN
eukprot:4615449-Pleurochrysis_carterae.AAC.2